MNKSELIVLAAEKAGMSRKDTAAIVTAVLETIKDTLVEGEKVQLLDFGTFEPRKRAERMARNPQNPVEIVQVPASRTVILKLGKGLKNALNQDSACMK